MRSTDRPGVQWCTVGEYRACFERYADGARFAVHGKHDRSTGYPRVRIVARGIVGGAGVVYEPSSAQLEAELERELVQRWQSLNTGGAES